MTKEQASILLDSVASLYPHWFKHDSKAMKLVRAMWEDALAEDSYEKVGSALKTWMATDITGRPPTLGWLRQQANISKQDGYSESELLAMIRRATSNALYHADEEFKRLPEVCKRAVGDKFTLQQWAMIDTDDFDTVVMSRVRRVLAEEKGKAEHVSLIPQKYKEVLGIGERTEELLPHQSEVAKLEQLNSEYESEQVRRQFIEEENGRSNC